MSQWTAPRGVARSLRSMAANVAGPQQGGFDP